MKTKTTKHFIVSTSKHLVLASALVLVPVVFADSFTTASTEDKIAPVISSLKTDVIKGKSATISWHTSEITNTHISITQEGGSDVKVRGDLEYASSHSKVLTKLEPLTSYDVTVKSTDLAKNSTSTTFTFETAEDVVTSPPGDGDNNTSFMPAVIMYLLN